MKDKEYIHLWKQFLEEYKEYVLSFDNKWIKNLESLILFININKRLPKQRVIDKIESSIGLWFIRQNTNYKNKIESMKDMNKYNRWVQFLEEYKEYFSDTEKQSINSDISQKSKEDISDEDEEYIFKPKPRKTMELKISSTTKSTESTEQKKVRIKSELELLHQRYKTLKSKNLHQEFNENKELWGRYHQIAEENEKSFPEEEIPRNIIIKELDKIKTKRTKLVVDMGCGKAQISECFSEDKRFEFRNFDHVSLNEKIEKCDISNTPLCEDSVEICILSLAMWGSNCEEYIRESNRILESNGTLYIIEPTKRWSEKDDIGNIIQGKEGSKLKLLLEKNGFKIHHEKVRKFCLFICNKIL
jgi:ribosomal RNA-processing protein 8